MKILFVVFYLHYAVSVDRSNFRTCKDSSFCNRQRNYFPDSPEYELDPNLLKIFPNKVQAIVLNKRNENRLNMTISYHSPSIFRMIFDESDPIRPRYRTAIGHALEEEPVDLPMHAKVFNDKLILSGSDIDHAHVFFNPLSVSFYKRNALQLSFNERGLLNFEHQMEMPPFEEKNDEIMPNISTTVESQDNNSYDEDGNQANSPNNVTENDIDTSTEAPMPRRIDWSESFKGHIDSRPHGPTSIGVDIGFNEFEYVYGLAEHADSLVLRDTDSTDPYRLYNLDVFEYEVNSPMALYGAVPVMWAHRSNGTVGIFWNNPTETWVDIKYSKSGSSESLLSKLPRIFSRSGTISTVRTRWMSESGVIDVFVIMADTPKQAMKAYSSLTGTTPLPPLFALANHQSRWNYKNEEDVLSVNDNYDKFNLPLDVIWLDIEYADGKRYLKWDGHNFINPNEMVRNITTKGRRLVVVVDPHIKSDKNWQTFQDFEAKGFFVKKPDGADYVGWCWPGSSSWPDFLRWEVADHWAELFTDSNFLLPENMFYAWNDMNEPSVFSGAEITIGKDMIHAGRWENRDIHNIYGLLVHNATWNGLLKRSKGTERPFVLTRAFFAGSQRTSAVWTGDNKASWDHLEISTPMLLSLALCGISFSGADVGGFFGDPSSELLVRWYQAAAFQPFLRSHAHMDTRRREPWLLSEENTNNIREALRMRYSLLPYWYTLFARSEFDGQPPYAPLFLHFPQDVETFSIENEHMLGEAMLIHPVVKEGAIHVEPYLPEGVWYHHSDWRTFHGAKSVSLSVDLSSIPVFYRGGYIVPKKDTVRRSSSMMLHDPYTIVICLDPSQNNSSGYLYYDDFHSTDVSMAMFYRMEYRARNDISTFASDPSGYFTMTRLPRPGTTVLSKPLDDLSEFIPKIERIVIVGFKVRPDHVTSIDLITGQRNRLTFAYSPSESVKDEDGTRAALLVIRKPDILVSDTWRVYVSTKAEERDEL